MIEEITGGVCAPKGFVASGVHCGIRKSRQKRDLSLIYTQTKAACAAVYTKNLVKGAPLIVTKNNIKDGYANAVICNSGNANTCDKDGVENAEKTCREIAKRLKIDKSDVVVASTGVIGERLNVDAIIGGMDDLVFSLSPSGSNLAAEGIMTTDTIKKEVAYKFQIDKRECRIAGIAKGSGMINPNMATMLCFITSDVSITPKLLKTALKEDVKDTFNMISIDGDTSTNDMVVVLSNGEAGNKIIEAKDENYQIFLNALHLVNEKLSRLIAKDGEGATKFIECSVLGADSKKTARIVAHSVVSSSLVKAAAFGSDANWGRVLCAIGYSGAKVDVEKIDVAFKSKAGVVSVCKAGFGLPFSESMAKSVLSEDEIVIEINLNSGSFSSSAYGCDLSYEYVKINGDYRT